MTMALATWLRGQSDRDDSVGDLARDVASDPDFPQMGRLHDYLQYLQERCACEGAKEALIGAWNEMMKRPKAFLDIRPDSVTIEVPVQYSMVLSVHVLQQNDFVASVSIGHYNRPHSFVKMTEEQARHVIAVLERAIAKPTEAEEATE